MPSRYLMLAAGLLFASAPGVEAQDVSAQPNFGDLRLKEGFTPDPQSVSVTSGGSIEVDLGDCSYGYVSSAPDVDLYYTTTGGASLYIYAEGDGDTMLLVNTPSGDWLCDDDSHGGLDPLVHIPSAADGLYDIWVGSYSDETHSATLHVSELEPHDPGGSNTPNVSAEPTYGDVNLTAGFLPDPHSVALRAGGSLEVNVGTCSYGYVAEAPDVDLYYTAVSGDSDLYIYVESDDDATLLINRPDGTWVCDDDGYEGTNPLVMIPKASGGRYDIWVGTYGEELTDATLHISERDPR